MITKFYKNWRASVIDISFTLKETIKNLNKTALRLCLVNRNNRFYGIITDGDIRRALLKGVKLSDNIIKAVNKKPFFIYEKNLNKKNLEELIKKSKSNFIPILNSKKKIVDIISEYKNNISQFNGSKYELVVITGGKGKRLFPLTKNIPKALIKVNGKPILEHIILKAKNEGIKNINLITNHKHRQIYNYFKNGKKFNVKINYFKEKKPLGTAGGLSLLNSKKNKILLVSNCDIVTNINFNDIINYHKSNKNKLTITSRFYKLDNPYGVIQLNKFNKVTKIDEKPSENYLISAGIYVMNSSILKYLKYSKKIDMTDFINNLSSKKIMIGTCPIHENWLDIGSLKDLKKINRAHNVKS